MFFNMEKIVEMDPYINFSDGFVEGFLIDVGGHTWYYFTENKVVMNVRLVIDIQIGKDHKTLYLTKSKCSNK